MVLFQQMLIFFIIMLLGYYGARKGILDDVTGRSLSWLVVHIANPALILSGCAGGQMVVKELLFTGILAVLLFLVLIISAEIVIPMFFHEREKRGCYKVMLVFSNMGFMGFPLISAVYGQSAIMYAAIFLIPFNLLIYTYGIFRIGKMGKREDLEGRKTVQWKPMLNSGVIACLLAIVIEVTRFPVPEMPMKLIEMLGGMTAPLSMLIIGASFRGLSIKKLITDKKLLGFSFLKLMALPVAGMLFLKQFVENEVLLGVCFIVLAAPAGSMVVILSKQYGGDEDTAVKGVAFTTLLSVLTMPLAAKLAGL